MTHLLEEALYARRKRMKISQDDLAERTGLSRNCIQQMECHEHLPQINTLGHCSIPVRFAKSLSAAEHNMTATVAAQLAGAWQVAGSITPFLLFHGRKPPSFLSNQQVLSPCI